MKPNVGDYYPTWFSGRYDGRSVVLEVRPYTGRFPQWFTWVVRVTAPRTDRQWMELCV